MDQPKIKTRLEEALEREFELKRRVETLEKELNEWKRGDVGRANLAMADRCIVAERETFDLRDKLKKAEARQPLFDVFLEFAKWARGKEGMTDEEEFREALIWFPKIEDAIKAAGTVADIDVKCSYCEKSITQERPINGVVCAPCIEDWTKN